MTVPKNVSDLLEKLNEQPEGARSRYIQKWLWQLESDMDAKRLEQIYVVRRNALVAKYPFLDSEYVASIVFWLGDGSINAINLKLDRSSPMQYTLWNNGFVSWGWSLGEQWDEGYLDDEYRSHWYKDTSSAAKSLASLVALMQRIVDEVDLTECFAADGSGT